MASIVSAVFVVTFVCATVSAHQSSPAELDSLKTVSDSNLDFSNSLYKVMSHKEGNLFFSPASIYLILAMTSYGARGVTEQEMAKGLYLPDDHRMMKNGFRHLMSSIRANTRSTVKIANKVFTDTRFKPKAKFVHIAEKYFKSGSKLLDFKHKAEESRVKINSWVEKHTEHKIKDFVPEGSLDEDTAMVLVNALYFKGDWNKVFDKSTTKMEPFHVSANVTKNVPMMNMFVEGHFAYIDSKVLMADILEIPYLDRKVSMIIVLPKEKDGLSLVESKLAGLRLSTLIHSKPSYPHVELSLPKFKLEESTDLKDTLIKMGMKTMFSDEADFSGLARGSLQVSQVLHKAFIEVDEGGTEAAAVSDSIGKCNVVVVETIIPMSLMKISPPPQEVIFKADHAFMFKLVNNDMGTDGKIKRTVLFMGRIAEPV